MANKDFSIMQKLHPSVYMHTDGMGLWSNKAKEVELVAIEVLSNELRVYFDTQAWDVSKDGLIYTDQTFLRELQAYLKTTTLPWIVDYSEAGMQGDDFVSLDIL